MMKASDTPRKVYVRHGITHVCFSGKTFAPPNGETEITPDMTVIVTVDEDGKTATVAHKRPKKKGIVETWKARKPIPHRPKN